MHPLFSLLRVAHAHSTHEKLALDALRYLQGEHVDLWRRLLLKHHDEYLLGATAPDRKFRDFRNHVLYPADGYWGGACDTAVAWFDRTVAELRRQDWPRAAFAAGVLGHYCTDPFNPLHTGQSSAANVVHRAVEASVAACYDELFQAAQRRGAPELAASTSDDWLPQFLRRGAGKAHAALGPLLTGFQFDLAVDDPPAGLDPRLRQMAAELLAASIVGLARVLGRAFAASEVRPPETSLVLETALAAATVPWHWAAGRAASHAEQRRIGRMYDEYKLTGRVEQHLTDDVRSVRDLYLKERQARRAANLSKAAA